MSQFRYVIGPDTRITFPDKPSEAIRSLLKGAGFRWSPSAGCWWRRGFVAPWTSSPRWNARSARASRTALAGCARAAEGFFRNEGAATPVRCNQCQAVAVYWESLPTAERERLRKLSQTSELGAAQLAYSCRPDASPQPDRFDLDYEERCRETCGL